jgi:hypothetical protein
MYYFIDRLYKSKLNFIGPRGMTQEGPPPSRVHVCQYTLQSLHANMQDTLKK